MHVEKVNTRAGVRPRPWHPHGRSGSGSAERLGHGRRNRDGQARPGQGRGEGGPREPSRRELRVPSPRGFLPPRQKAFESSSSRSVRTQRFGEPGSRPASGVWGRPPAPQGAASFSPTVRRGVPRATETGAAGLRAKAAGPRGRGPGRGRGERELYRPGSRAATAAADARGSGSSLLFPAADEQPARAAPPPPGGTAPSRRCHPSEALRGERRGGAEGEAARSIAGRQPPQLPGCTDAAASARISS